MALQVGLPLNGNTKNQGCSGDQYTIGVTPSYVDGKIGKAMSTGSLYMTAAQTQKIFNGKEMTFAFGIYVPSSSTDRGVLFGNEDMTAPANRRFTMFQYPTKNDLHLSWQTSTISRNANILATIDSNFFPSDVWTHVVVRYSAVEKTIRLYKMVKNKLL